MLKPQQRTKISKNDHKKLMHWMNGGNAPKSVLFHQLVQVNAVRFLSALGYENLIVSYDLHNELGHLKFNALSGDTQDKFTHVLISDGEIYFVSEKKPVFKVGEYETNSQVKAFIDDNCNMPMIVNSEKDLYIANTYYDKVVDYIMGGSNWRSGDHLIAYNDATKVKLFIQALHDESIEDVQFYIDSTKKNWIDYSFTLNGQQIYNEVQLLRGNETDREVAIALKKIHYPTQYVFSKEFYQRVVMQIIVEAASAFTKDSFISILKNDTEIKILCEDLAMKLYKQQPSIEKLYELEEFQKDIDNIAEKICESMTTFKDFVNKSSIETQNNQSSCGLF